MLCDARKQDICYDAHPSVTHIYTHTRARTLIYQFRRELVESTTIIS